MASTIQELLVRFKGDTRGLEQSTSRAAKATKIYANNNEKANKRVQNSFNGTTTAIKATAVALAALQGVRIADTFINIEQRLKNVTNSTEEYVDVYNKLFAISQKTGSSFESNADAFVKLNVSLTDTIKQTTDLTKIVEILNRGFAAAGTNAATQAGATLQLTQGLASNFQNAAQELNSLIDGAPLVAAAIAKELGGNAATDLKKFAAEGKLTSETFLLALQAAEETINSFEIPDTVGRSVIRLKNNFLQLIGAVNETTKVSELLIFIINGVAEGFKAAQFIVASFAAGVQDAVALASRGLLALTQNAVDFGNQFGLNFQVNPAFRTSVSNLTKNAKEAQKEIRALSVELFAVEKQQEKSSNAEVARQKLKQVLLKQTGEITKEQLKRQKELTKAANEEIKRQQEAVKELKSEFADFFTEASTGYNDLRRVAVRALQDIFKNTLRISLGGQAGGGLGGSIATGLFNVLGQGGSIANTAKFSTRSTASIAASAAKGSFGPGFATGGSMTVGGTGGTDSQLVQFKATPNERITVERPGQNLRKGGSGGDTMINQNINISTGVQQTVRAEIFRLLPAIQGSTTKAVEDARLRGKIS